MKHDMPDRYALAFRLYPYALSPDQDAATPARHKVVVFDMISHRVDEADLFEAGRLEGAADVRDPSGWPIAGDFCAAGMVIRMNK